MESNPEAFKSRLNALITASGLSHKDIEQKTGIAAGNISHYRTGKIKPSFDALLALADLFEISLDDLMRGKTETTADTAIPYMTQWSALLLSIPTEARPYALLFVKHYLLEAEKLSASAASKKPYPSRATETCAATSDSGSQIA